jgi:hypothetical protein
MPSDPYPFTDNHFNVYYAIHNTHEEGINIFDLAKEVGIAIPELTVILLTLQIPIRSDNKYWLPRIGGDTPNWSEWVDHLPGEMQYKTRPKVELPVPPEKRPIIISLKRVSNAPWVNFKPTQKVTEI